MILFDLKFFNNRNLISKSIYGTISTELGDLNRLQQLFNFIKIQFFFLFTVPFLKINLNRSLTGNNFNGTLPTELGKLHELNLL